MTSESTSVEISGEIDTPLLQEKNTENKAMASWANIGVTGNIRDVLTQQVSKKS